MKKLHNEDKIMDSIQLPNLFYTDEQLKAMGEPPLIFIPNDKTYVEILGYRIDTDRNIKTLGEFGEYLQHIKEVEEENKQLLHQMAEIGEYILTKYEEAKLDAQYIDGVRYPSVQERIYEDILGRFELN